MKIHPLLFLPVLCLTSCATITRGVHEKLSVTSDPSGANVTLSTGEKGVTPAKFVKERRTENFTVTVSKPGYTSQTVKVESKFGGTGGGAMAGNLLLGGAIGLGVDALEFDSRTGLIYVSTGGGDGALSIFREQSPDKYSLVQSVKTLPGARTMALDQKTGRVYLPVADVGPRPDPTPASPNPRAPMIPGTFSVLLVGQ